MNSKSKITIVVLCQIALILGSFLSAVIWTDDSLIILQVILVAINVLVHVGLLFLISKIFKNEFKKNLKSEKLATIGEVSSRLVHELRNPLSYINMSTQMLKSKTTEKNTVEKLEIIEKGIDQMSQQLNDVMTFVKLKEPELKLQDVTSILKECLDKLKIPDSVKVSLPEKSFQIKCDRNQFEVLFINLISNAVDSIQNSGSIEICVNPGSDETRIEIIDSGDGIPEDRLEQIFEPLVTYKKSRTGLGLANCKSIVENHKGTIHAKNNPTTFTIILPNN